MTHRPTCRSSGTLAASGDGDFVSRTFVSGTFR
jgi:hypothetical protein